MEVQGNGRKKIHKWHQAPSQPRIGYTNCESCFRFSFYYFIKNYLRPDFSIKKSLYFLSLPYMYYVGSIHMSQTYVHKIFNGRFYILACGLFWLLQNNYNIIIYKWLGRRTIFKMYVQSGREAKWKNGNRALIYCQMQYLYALNIGLI